MSFTLLAVQTIIDTINYTSVPVTGVRRVLIIILPPRNLLIDFLPAVSAGKVLGFNMRSVDAEY